MDTIPRNQAKYWIGGVAGVLLYTTWGGVGCDKPVQDPAAAQTAKFA